MRARRPGPAAIALAGLSMLLAVCTPQHEEPAVAPSQRAEAQGRVTMITAANAPAVLPLDPIADMKAPPFSPLVPAGAGDAVEHTRTWTTDDGLPSDFILSAWAGPNGMLWFGTNGGGLTRFDGRSFTTLTTVHGLPDISILCLGGDRNGDLWIGTSTGGLCRYDGRTFHPVPLSTDGDLWGAVITMWEDPDGTLWFGTRGKGVHRYDGQRFTHFGEADGLRGFIMCFARDAEGALWLAHQGGLARYDGTRFVHHAELDGIDLTRVRSILRGTGTDLWLGHYNGGVTHLVFTEAGPQATHYPVIAGETVRVTQLFPDGDDAFWIASADHGAMRFALGKNGAPIVQRLPATQGREGDEVHCIARDRQGDLWFCMSLSGLVQYHGSAFTSYRFLATGIAEDADRTIWAGTYRGMARFDGGSFSEQRAIPKKELYNYSIGVDNQGRVGIGVNAMNIGRPGVSWNVGARYQVRAPRSVRGQSDAFWVMQDSHGRTWTTSRGGALCYSATDLTSYTTKQGLG
ncbi:MAG: two-component regulator propeller domain-containing protein, partial [Flavobacteriales bacterium]